MGPQYNFHYKLASIQNIVGITFMFGAGMPILFLIGAISLVILYFVERYTIAKFYRQPPNYKRHINLQTGKILSIYSILLYFSLGFWFYSNQQIFANKVQPKLLNNEIPSTRHTLTDSVSTLNPGSIILFFLVLNLVI